MSFWDWFTGERVPPRQTFIWRGLGGEETRPFTLHGPETASITDLDHKTLDGQNGEPFLKLGYEKRKGAWVIEQLAPVLELDGATLEWAAKKGQKRT